MKKMTLLLSLVFSILLAGCATTANYEKILNSWLGNTEELLIQKWGVPDTVYESGNRKYLVYYRQNTVYFPGTPPTYQSWYDSLTQTVTTTQTGGYSGRSFNYYCKTTYTVENGRIIHWQWQGNACTAYE
ncbi:hypothetical protein OFAG_00935 [Oxalobacter formigenes HOxBLS]|uniref:Lipoprotein n=2 Tax=Oxalobacter paraformigenes TaxID=556268 RepID=C3X3J6_9BURK|nr:hypothetical protein OFAG_00935 [Oxalobacter paraformigenes]